MKERPIIFSAPMVRAILEGCKTQTRRIVKDQPPVNCAYLTNSDSDGFVDGRKRWGWTDGATVDYAWHPWIGDEPAWQTCVYGQPGNRLWVRENFQPLLAEEGLPEDADYQTGEGYAINYTATSLIKEFYDFSNDKAFCAKVTPSIFMPRWASRITLEITDVQVGPLQEISEEDALAEGILDWGGASPYRFTHVTHDEMERTQRPVELFETAREAYAKLWDTINGKTHPWASNPWVWAISFKRIEMAGEQGNLSHN